MSKLVLGLKLLKNNILANVIVTFQIIAVIILCCNMISLFDLLFMCSDKLEKINEENYSVYTPYVENDFRFEGNEVLNNDMIAINTDINFKDLKGVEDIISINYTQCFSLPDYTGENCNVIAYNDYIYKYFPLETKNKTVFSNDNNQEYIEAVATRGSETFKVGNIVEMYFNLPNSTDMKSVKIKIIDTLKEPAYVLSLLSSGNIGATELFESISNNITGVTTLIIDESELQQLNVNYYKQPSNIVVYEESTSDVAIAKIEDYMRKGGTVVSKRQLLDTTAESGEWVKNKYLPKLFFTFIVALSAMTATAIINTQKSIRTLQIFFLCGSKWKDCLLISLSNVISVSVFAGIPAFLMFFLSYKLNLSLFGCLYASYRTYFCCILILLLFSIVSVISPIVILKRNNPKKVVFEV